jgi:uncharacterized RDD family membrane protein YckC
VSQDPFSEKDSPLKRYLAKRAQPADSLSVAELKGGDGFRLSTALSAVVLAIVSDVVLRLGRGKSALGARPVAAHSSSPAVPKRLAKPANFSLRFVAYLVDLCVIALLTTVLGGSVRMAIFFLPEFVGDSLFELIRLFIVYLYFGWFYSKHGATPGKMLMGLEIYELGTGLRLSYWRSFFRESVGKLLSAMIFFFGFLCVLFRADRRALHDLVFDTLVVQRTV